MHHHLLALLQHQPLQIAAGVVLYLVGVGFVRALGRHIGFWGSVQEERFLSFIWPIWTVLGVVFIPPVALIVGVGWLVENAPAAIATAFDQIITNVLSHKAPIELIGDRYHEIAGELVDEPQPHMTDDEYDMVSRHPYYGGY